MPTRHRAQKHTYLGLEHEKFENQVPNILYFEKKLKDAHKKSVQNGCDTFPNELMRFHFKATPIWKKNQKLNKNAVICQIWL